MNRGLWRMALGCVVVATGCAKAADPDPPANNGTNGTNGTNGVSVTTAAEPPGANCVNGGTRLTSASGTTYVCNGAEGVSSAWSDGSAGDLTLSSNTDWTVSPPATPNNQFHSITVSAGVTWTVPSGLQLRVATTVTLGANALISVKPAPKSPGANPEPGIATRGADHRAGGVGVSALQATSLLHPAGGGSGAGVVGTLGGGGGGAFVIRAAGGFNVGAGAQINADGVGGDNNLSLLGGGGAGGGAGGAVILAWRTGGLVPTGLIVSARGGPGGNGSAVGNYCGGGGGGGGVITLLGPNATTVAVTTVLTGGAHGASAGAISAGNLSGSGGGASGGNGGSACDGVQIAPVSGGAGVLAPVNINDPAGMFN